MDASPQHAPLTAFEALPWLGMTLDYTDKLCALIPEDLLDWRPTDPTGGYFFSLAEIVMHCADSRLMFARQLAGLESEEGYWSREAAEGEEKQAWYFKSHGGKQALLNSLASARKELQPWLDCPAAKMNEPTAGTQAVLDKMLATLKEQGKEPDATMLKRGPASVMRVLMACAVHESGHRGGLQTLLRQQGVAAGFDVFNK